MEAAEEKVFVCSLAYSTLMDSSGATDQDEKLTEEASTSGASSGSESPGSPTPLVGGGHVVEVNHNGISLTSGVKHSPLFRTRLPHLSAHQLALTAGARRQRYQSPYVPKGQYAQPQSYDKWAKRRQTSRWTRRRRLERPLLWLASAILVCLLIAGIMIAVFWVSGSSSKKGTATVLLNDTNTQNTTTASTLSTPLTTLLTNLSPRVPPSPTGGAVNAAQPGASEAAQPPTSTPQTTSTVKSTTRPTTSTERPTTSTSTPTPTTTRSTTKPSSTTTRDSTSVSSTVIPASTSTLSGSTITPSPTTTTTTSSTTVIGGGVTPTISGGSSSTKVPDPQIPGFSLLTSNRTQTFPDNKNATDKPP